MYIIIFLFGLRFSSTSNPPRELYIIMYNIYHKKDEKSIAKMCPTPLTYQCSDDIIPIRNACALLSLLRSSGAKRPEGGAENGSKKVRGSYGFHRC